MRLLKVSTVLRDLSERTDAGTLGRRRERTFSRMLGAVMAQVTCCFCGRVIPIQVPTPLKKLNYAHPDCYTAQAISKIALKAAGSRAA